MMRGKRGETQLGRRWETIVPKEDERTGQEKNGGMTEGRDGEGRESESRRKRRRKRKS